MLLSIIISVIVSLSPQTDKKEQAKILAHKGFSQIEAREYKKAVKSFEKAIKLDKDCKEAHLGKGVAYYKWGDYNQREIYPEEYIKRALKIDPDYTDAKIHLGWALCSKYDDVEASEYMLELFKSEQPDGRLYYGIAKFFDTLHNFFYAACKRRIPKILEAAYDLGCDNTDFYYLYGWKTFLNDSLDFAIELYKKGMDLDKRDQNYLPLLDLGIIYFNMKDFSQSEYYFNEALSVMPGKIRKYFDETKNSEHPMRQKVITGLAVKYFLNDKLELTKKGKKYIKEDIVFYEPDAPKEQAFLFILSEVQKQKYLRYDTISERKKYFHKYFLVRDITPFNGKNEMLSEFEKRFNYIMLRFKNKTKLFSRGFDDRGMIYMKYGSSEFIYVDDEGNVRTADRGTNFRYTHLHQDMIFTFDKMGKLNPTLISMSSFDRKRVAIGTNSDGTTSLSSVSYLEAMGIRLKAMGINLLDISVVSVAGFLSEFAGKREELMTKKFVNYYPVKIDEKHLNFGHRAADFKYSAKTSLNEIYYGLKVENLKFIKENGKYKSTLKIFTRLLNSDLDLVKEDSMEYIIQSETEKKEGIAVNQLRSDASPGEYTLFIQIKNQEGNSSGVYTQDVRIEDYKSNELSMSDIQFSFSITDAKPGDKYVKNGLSITPYPFIEVSRSKPLSLYYEIYNLSQKKDGRTRYEITYNIKLIQHTESFIKRLFRIKGYKESISFGKKLDGSRSNTFDYTSLDLSNLRVGKYEITVEVKDLFNDKTTEKTDTFVLVE